MAQSQDAPIICQLGRYGDLIVILPALKAMAERYRKPITVVVSQEFSGLLDGVSYVKPWVVPFNWWEGTSKAKQIASKECSNVIVPQFWNDPSWVNSSNGKLQFKVHGRDWKFDGEGSDFGTAMWNRLGFTRKNMLEWPLVFDRRDLGRELQLYKAHVHTPSKPLVLYNFTAISSPFPYTPEMMRLLQPYRSRCELVDLGQIRAIRIYDLLGLYDRARGLITADTATANLAPASDVPTVWMMANTRYPKGNVTLQMRYDEVARRQQELIPVLEKWCE